MGIGSGAAGAARAAPIIYKARVKHGRWAPWPPQIIKQNVLEIRRLGLTAIEIRYGYWLCYVLLWKLFFFCLSIFTAQSPLAKYLKSKKWRVHFVSCPGRPNKYLPTPLRYLIIRENEFEYLTSEYEYLLFECEYRSFENILRIQVRAIKLTETLRFIVFCLLYAWP